MTPTGREELLLPFLLLTLPALVVLTVGVVRGRLAPAIGLLAIVVMPASAFTLGNLVLMEHAKHVHFCASCHEMANVVFSANQGGDDLAARHFRAHFPRREGCYECHSGYGIWGDVDAKRSGVAHMWATLTNSAEFPLEHEGPFDAAGCLKCHDGAEGFEAVPIHGDEALRSAIEDGDLDCSGGCHPPAHEQSALLGPQRGLLGRPAPSAEASSTHGPAPMGGDEPKAGEGTEAAP